ncbi:hypothetical protein [Pontibacter pamirensis]|uniref:hypothetical protein n=1 Tax=Pontibacter pamirensis TaxID=2562824 RepID=UPI00138968BC|nr:hypothetical protein [Pontibacter pamirensis]
MKATDNNFNQPQQELIIDLTSRHLLHTIAKWGKLLAVVAFVMLGLVLLIAGYEGIWNGFGEKDATLVMVKLLYKLVFFFPALYLFRFSNKMEVALNSSNQELITASLVNLKIFFRFLGIFTLIFLVVGTISMLVLD